jgi:hypothetical protein
MRMNRHEVCAKCVQYYRVHVFGKTVDFNLYAHLILTPSARELTGEEKMYSFTCRPNHIIARPKRQYLMRFYLHFATALSYVKRYVWTGQGLLWSWNSTLLWFHYNTKQAKLEGKKDILNAQWIRLPMCIPMHSRHLLCPGTWYEVLLYLQLHRFILIVGQVMMDTCSC